MDRPYVSPIRAEQVRLTRRRITDAAHALFLERGYTATTIAAVAASAGVSAQTVYNVFGTKPALLKHVYDVRLVGDDEPIPMQDRPDVRALYTEEDAARFLRGYATLGGAVMERLGPLLVVIANGAGSDPDLAAHIVTVNGERLVGTGMVAQRISDLGALRRGLDVDRARDRIWTLNSLEVWNLLTGLRGWSHTEAVDWIGEAMCDAVLDRG
ncbi:TetR/AcrR family transcriptional regulator [Antrihabitans sp. YC2-6]|uniref:TetR/AcrR family transcriptional regulator n=1 Tax=Antrihabitans sp. YC2-6 TaxID=2799498 RepID=UPI0018F299A4|nr:TetR family transcriptional regulator [Antrihabitans sp. YC2-6]MBJ8345324.1 TetR family transcriptional regulator [Antrihabitans sp. YC2-6]